MNSQQLWVEPVGGIIIARVRGVPSEELLRECQYRVLLLVSETGRNRVLYDALELELPSADPAFIQQKLDSELNPDVQLRRAIVVSNSRAALLGRIAFGDGEYRVFYSDMGAAMRWLEE